MSDQYKLLKLSKVIFRTELKEKKKLHAEARRRKENSALRLRAFAWLISPFLC